MKTAPNQTRSPAKSVDTAQAQRQEREQQLHREECARRGVRFLPRQVMRPIYERAGLL